MSPGLKLISINIERSKHLDLVTSFLEKVRPDVVCIQELLERDIPRIEAALGCSLLFSPGMRHQAEGQPDIMGIAIGTRFPILNHTNTYYAGDPTKIATDPPRQIGDTLSLLTCDLEKEGVVFKIATTHFGWTPDGYPNDAQRRDLNALLPLLEKLGEVVLTGDFNAPRMLDGKPGETFSAIAARYKDNIPAQYVTSLDRELHRAGHLDRMVDGIFSTPGYQVSDVELVSGVSDHCAVVATVSKN